MSAAREPRPPFVLQVGYDQDELLGARWWHEALPLPASPPKAGRAAAREVGLLATRRSALQKLLLLGGGAVVAGFAVRGCSGRGGGGGSTVQTIDHASLELQRTRGLATGAEATPFTWPHERATTDAGTPLDRSLLPRLAADLRPPDPADRPDHVPTLLQCTTGPGGAAFAAELRPVLSPAMQVAFARGEAIRELLGAAARPSQWAFVVDLPGPESVAFAAGLQPRATALFTFDNWPHPLGVVPAHLTLAAIVHYRERFVAATAAADRDRARAYVLDRDRLAAYGNEPRRFDNRYRVRLPTAGSLRTRGVAHVLYVVPEGAAPRELDDLAERFVEYDAAGIRVRMLGLGDLTLAVPDGDAGAANASPRYYWHGSPLHHWWFWTHFGAASLRAPVAPQRPPRASFGDAWAPAPRPPVAGLREVGRTRESVRVPRGSSGSGGSWGRTGGGYGGA